MRPGILLVDLDCPTCCGTGRVQTRARVGPIRYGGHTPTRVTGERLCSCVRVAPVYSTLGGGVSIGAPVERERSGA
jgi:hypothetical protein